MQRRWMPRPVTGLPGSGGGSGGVAAPADPFPVSRWLGPPLGQRSGSITALLLAGARRLELTLLGQILANPPYVRLGAGWNSRFSDKD